MSLPTTATMRSQLGRAVWALRSVSPSTLLLAVVVILTGFISLYPIVTLLRGTLSTGRITNPGPLTLQNYITVYGAIETYQLLGTTVVYAVGVAVVSVSMGLLVAWIAVRTNAPLARHMTWLVFLPYAVPGSLTAISWVMLANPNNGFLNGFARSLLGPETTIFNVYSFPWMVFVAANHGFPLAFSFIVPALHSSDPALEDASRMCGAGPLRTLKNVTFPLAWPACLSTIAILFILGLEAFDTPAFIGLPANIYVLSTQVFVSITGRIPPDYGRAATYGVLPLIVALMVAYYYQRTISRGERYATITGKGYRPGKVDLGPAKWLATGVVAVVFFVVAVIPLLTIIAVSAAPSLLAVQKMDFSGFGFDNYGVIFSEPRAVRVLINTLLLGVGGATVAMFISFLVSFVTTRLKFPGRGLIEYLAFFPFSFASVLLAVGILWGYIRFPIPVYGTLAILGIGYITKFLPYGLRSMSAAFLQVHKELEEAAQVTGAGVGRRLRTILLPLSMPGVIAGWSVLALVFMRELTISLLLWTPASEVVSVRLYSYNTDGRFGELSAMGMVLVLVSLILVFIARKASRVDSVARF
ncbi:MAG: iron ABC transporter permease [Chloroflexota bacterium]